MEMRISFQQMLTLANRYYMTSTPPSDHSH
jgi:hypothetical protein